MTEKENEDNKLKTLNKRKSLEKKLAMAAIIAEVSSTLPEAIKVAQTQTKSFDTSLYEHHNNENVALNEANLIGAHNVGENNGDTIPGFNNQTMSTGQLLDLTSNVNGGIAVVSIPVTSENNQLVVNHGGVSDGSSPVTLNSQLDDIKSWSDSHPNDIILIQISNESATVGGSNNVTPDEQNQFYDQLHQQYGNQIFTQTDLQQYQGQNNTTNMPSQEWLTEHNYKAVVITEGMGNNNNVFPATTYVSSPYWNQGQESNASLVHERGEDRSGAFYFMNGLFGDKIPLYTTKQTDSYNNSPGITVLDNLQANDPRLVAAGNRGKLIYDPDMSMFGGMVQFSRGDESIAAFSLGLGIDTGAATFSIASAIFKAYLNSEFIKNLDKNVSSMIANIDKTDISVFKKENPKLIKGKSEEDVVRFYCKHKIYSKIREDTLVAGLGATTSLSASVFSIGLMFPPIMPITSVAALAVAGTCLVGTGIGYASNNYFISKKIDGVLKVEEIDAKVKSLNKTGDIGFIDDKLESKENLSFLEKTSSGFTMALLATRVTSIAKYGVAAIG